MANYRANVAALIVDQRGCLLICERFKVPGAWQFPQGGIDEGESAEETLRREVEEEVGLPPDCYEIRARRDGYRYIYPQRVKKRKRGACYDGQEQTYFLCQLKEDAPEVNLEREPREFSQFRWVYPDKFSLAWLPDFKKEVYQKVLADFFDVKLG